METLYFLEAEFLILHTLITNKNQFNKTISTIVNQLNASFSRGNINLVSPLPGEEIGKYLVF